MVPRLTLFYIQLRLLVRFLAESGIQCITIIIAWFHLSRYFTFTFSDEKVQFIIGGMKRKYADQTTMNSLTNGVIFMLLRIIVFLSQNMIPTDDENLIEDLRAIEIPELNLVGGQSDEPISKKAKKSNLTIKCKRTVEEIIEEIEQSLQNKSNLSSDLGEINDEADVQTCLKKCEDRRKILLVSDQRDLFVIFQIGAWLNVIHNTLREKGTRRVSGGFKNWVEKNTQFGKTRRYQYYKFLSNR